ncbi:MAG: 4-(cytidine 5'-diphospho)-2-C-methyl-D-erythritol kinase [Rhodothermales bacterium]|nr:4-(cytidine 5'-diphospho)-2-C-methyl-D-erythritol kinase [Rhodothermales bacterium]
MRHLQRQAPAKINLGLHVKRKRADGFHEIETVFLRIGWSDRLTVVPAPELTITCSDPAIPVDDRNTCMKAARLLATQAGTTLGAHIELEKRVPYGAGLGSGSSDAATTLQLLVNLWGLEIREDVLMDVAASVGSDVPCFLKEPAAYAEGRGELLSDLKCGDGQAYEFPFTLVVVVPPIHVSSADAYRSVIPRDTRRPSLVSLVCTNDLALWRERLKNDFEASVLRRHAEIAAVKQQLMDLGAGYASLSGSGSAVYGVFESESTAELAAAAGVFAGMKVWHGTAG